MSKRAVAHVIIASILIISIFQPIHAGQAELQKEGRVKYNPKENKATVGSNGYIFSFVGRGGTPFYHFADPDNRTYFVKFMKLLEFIDVDGDGAFDPEEVLPGGKYTLPSVDWRFTVNEAEQTFTFSTPTSATDPQISFVNHYHTEHPELLKFDIYITNWAWQEASHMLALRFDIHSETEDETSGSAIEHGVELSEHTYFEAVPIAKVDSNDAPVGISITENSVFLAYSHFTSLEHDPMIGFRGIPVIVPGVTGSITIIEYSYTMLVATVILIGLVYSRRR